VTVATQPPTATKIHSLDEALEAARARFVAANSKSSEAHNRATSVMPGGNTRTTLFYPPFPIMMSRGEGSRLWDVDGHEYVDFLGDYTAGLFGHSEPSIREAIVSALDRGLSLSAVTSYEAELAHLLIKRFPSIELIRFTNSGTEANLMALAAAVNFTGRKRILVFTGGYHGAVLTFPKASSPINVPHDFILSPYNNADKAAALIRQHRDDLAAILVEPMLGASGCIPGDIEFLQVLREESEHAGALLIFDEVMTSRLGPQGRQGFLGIRPDLTTLGKYIAGAMSFGAFGGRADVMTLFDNRKPEALPHAGTFNNNVLSMAAGVVAMRDRFTPERANALTEQGEDLRRSLNAVCAGSRMQFTGLGSLMNMHPVAQKVRGVEDLQDADVRLKDLFFYHLMDRGIYVARRGFITVMLPIGEGERRALVQATKEFASLYSAHLEAA
jgi:glutamate-1-semialdehyde 2,1-aminomutase